MDSSRSCAKCILGVVAISFVIDQRFGAYSGSQAPDKPCHHSARPPFGAGGMERRVIHEFFPLVAPIFPPDTRAP